MSETPVCEVCGREKWHRDLMPQERRNASCDRRGHGATACYVLGYERARAQVEQLIGDKQAISEDYTNARAALSAAEKELAETREAKEAAYRKIYKLLAVMRHAIAELEMDRNSQAWDVLELALKEAEGRERSEPSEAVDAISVPGAQEGEK